MFMVSLDPAQLHDYSALAVIEYSAADKAYHIIDLNRKQALPYTEIVSWSKKVFLNPRLKNPKFIMDIGGVGKAIQDMLTAEGINSTGIQLTGGDTEHHEGNTYFVTKSHVIGKFLAAWDQGRVLMPSTAEFLNPFKKELRAFRGGMTSHGRARFEVEQGEHDDLVMAVAQAIWWAETRPKPQRLVFRNLGERLDPFRDPACRIRPVGMETPPSRIGSPRSFPGSRSWQWLLKCK